MDKKLENEQLGRKTIAEFVDMPKTPVVVLLDNVRSLHNVGSVFRTCDAFAIEKLYLCGYTGTPPHKEIHKTALGATESVLWQHEADILARINNLKQEGYILYAVEQTQQALSLHQVHIQKQQKYALVFGNEVEGVQHAVLNACHAAIEIAQGGTKHSLNVSVSAGVVLWEFFKKNTLSAD
ncbi:MAG: RNA methyltransferase [Bacteroidetes bacterium]|nr:RNA methyltransferase [Bacteroidota bacterium]